MAENTDFKGKWIWGDNPEKANTWMCFKKRFHYTGKDEISKVRIAVDSKYWFWINGEMVVFEGGLNRGPKPGAGYYDETDIGRYLKPGENTLSVLVWYWGNEGRNNADSGKGGFLFELLSKELNILSDSSWNVKVHPAYIETDSPYPSYLYGGYNVGFDASEDILGWQNPEFDETSWDFAKEYGKPYCMPWGELYKRPIPLIKDYGIKDYTKITKKDDETYVCKLSYGSHLTPYFKIDADSPGLKVDIRSDRYLVNGGPGDEMNVYNCHRTEYLTAKGEQEFESLDWIFGEEVIYKFPKGVKVKELRYRETGYDTNKAGNFLCDDDFLNKLYEKSIRTLYVCIRDNFMDCPDRERGQWIGDVSSQVPQVFYAMDRKTDNLIKKAIYDFLNWRQENILCGNVPGRHKNELPVQSLNACSDIGMIMEYYKNTGDSSVLRDSCIPVYNYLMEWEIGDDGLVKKRNGGWDWYDHGIENDEKVIENSWYYLALRALVKMSVYSEDFKGLNEVKNRIESIAKNFNKIFWKEKGYSSTEYYDDRANAMAVIAGLAPPDKWPVVIEVLKNKMNSTPFMEGYVLEAMFMMGYKDEAMNRMRFRYDGLVSNSNSTLWEDFHILGTKNHAWSGMPMALMVKYLAGIKAVEPAYETYRVEPFLGDLKEIHAVVPSVRGDISVDISRTAGGFDLRIRSPEKTKGILGIPSRSSDCRETGKIYLGNNLVWDIENGAADIIPVKYLGKDRDYIRFELDPGNCGFNCIE